MMTKCGFRHSGKLVLGTEQLKPIFLKRIGTLFWLTYKKLFTLTNRLH